MNGLDYSELFGKIIKLTPKYYYCKCQKPCCHHINPEKCFMCSDSQCFVCDKLNAYHYWSTIEKVAVAKESIEQIYNVTENLLKKITNDSPLHTDIAYIKAFCEFYLDIDRKEK